MGVSNCGGCGALTLVAVSRFCTGHGFGAIVRRILRMECPNRWHVHATCMVCGYKWTNNFEFPNDAMPTTVVITIEGGVVVSVSGLSGQRIHVRDYDIDGMNEETLIADSDSKLYREYFV